MGKIMLHKNCENTEGRFGYLIKSTNFISYLEKCNSGL